MQFYGKFEKDVNGKIYRTRTFIAPQKAKTEIQKELSFYHPLGGHWKSDKKERFKYSLLNILKSQIAVYEFV